MNRDRFYRLFNAFSETLELKYVVLHEKISSALVLHARFVSTNN